MTLTGIQGVLVPSETIQPMAIPTGPTLASHSELEGKPVKAAKAHFTGDLIRLKSEVRGEGGAVWVLWEWRLRFLLSSSVLLLALPLVLRISQVFNKR